jgi:uncharacterized membrane protein YidH (DUF202 family)
MKRLLTLLILAWAMPVFAQPGIDEMHQASQQLTSSFFSAFDCSLVLAAILGIIGAVRIYHNWQMGKQEITADVAAWFYAAIFMILAGAFLRAIFGI